MEFETSKAAGVIDEIFGVLVDRFGWNDSQYVLFLCVCGCV